MNDGNAKSLPMGQSSVSGRTFFTWLFFVIALTVFTLTSAYSYPLFHTLAEGFSVFISFGIFVLAWNTRDYIEDDYLLLLGVVSLCVGIIDTCHVLSYQGVAFFSGYDDDLPTQLWVASRYLQSIVFTAATLSLSRRADAQKPLPLKPVLAVCLAVTALILLVVFAGWFPACFVAGVGLTPFKQASEVAVSLLFAWCALLLWRHRFRFEPAVARLLLASLGASFAAELLFVFYLRVFDFSNLAGHLCKVASQYFIYCAIVKKGLREPLDLLFRQLHSNQEQLRQLNETLEATVLTRTAQLRRDIEERKQVEAILARQTSQLSALLHSLPDLISFKDEDGIYLGCNSEFGRFIGRDPWDVAGRTDYDLFPKALADTSRAADRLVVEKGAPRQSEDWFCYPDGKTVLLDTLKAPLRSAAGAPMGILEVSRDITKIKTHEAEIERLKDLYAALSYISQVITRVRTPEELFREIPPILVEFGKFAMVWIGWEDAATQRVEVVAQHGDVTGYLKGVRVYSDDRPEGRGPTGRAIREGRTYVCNDYFGDANTRPWQDAARRAKWRSSAALPIRGAGDAKGALTVYAWEVDFFGPREIGLLEEAAREISFALENIDREKERVQGVEELRKLSRVVDQSPVSIIITDVDGFIEFVNPRFCELTGYQREEVLGRKPNMLKSDQVAPQVYRELWNTIASGGVWRGELINKKKNGDLFREHVTISPLKGPDGGITHFVATKEDITDQYRLREQLLQSQKMEAIGQLAGGVAHDFNNILTVIIGYVHILGLRETLEPAEREAVAQIGAAAERASQVTRGLLAFSRSQVLVPKPVNLNDIVAHMQKFLVRIIGEDIRFSSVCHDGLLMIKADAGQIEQVLFNLAANARDAMPGGGSLTLETGIKEIDETLAASSGCGRAGRFACITMTDTGTGIDNAVGQKIFDPFFTTKPAGKGTGLGMSIVHGIVSQHDGFIWFESEPGVGTSFHVCLPLMEAAHLIQETEAPDAQWPGGTETILLAEDDSAVRKVAQATLEKNGYRVIVAQDGLQAVDRFREHESKIALVITDLIMPNLSGREAFREIRKLNQAVKVLFMSGYSDCLDSRNQPEQGADLLMKPVRPRDLLQAVRSILDR